MLSLNCYFEEDKCQKQENPQEQKLIFKTRLCNSK